MSDRLCVPLIHVTVDRHWNCAISGVSANASRAPSKASTFTPLSTTDVVMVALRSLISFGRSTEPGEVCPPPVLASRSVDRPIPQLERIPRGNRLRRHADDHPGGRPQPAADGWLCRAVDPEGGRRGRGATQPAALPLRLQGSADPRAAGHGEPAATGAAEPDVRRGEAVVAALRAGLRLPRGRPRLRLRAGAAGDDRRGLVEPGDRRRGP